MSDQNSVPPPPPEESGGWTPQEPSGTQPEAEPLSALAPEAPEPPALAPEPPAASAAAPADGTSGPVPPPPPPASPSAGAVPPAPGAYPPPPPSGAAYPPPPAGAYPPPPPGAYPPPNAQGGYALPTGGAPARAFSVGDALNYGWKGFQNNLGPIVVIMAAIIVVNGLFSLLGRVTRDSTFLSLGVSLLSAFVSLLIGLGLIRAALIILDGRRPEVADVLNTDGIGVYIVASLLVGAIVTVGFILCIIPGLIAAFLLQFYGYAIVDKRTDTTTVVPNADPIGAIRTSYEVVSANVGNLILLALVGFGIAIATVIGLALCVVPGLVIMFVAAPVMAIALAYAWRYFTHGVIAAQL